jgi:outer membrane murein-binding lipoprotein Lpp
VLEHCRELGLALQPTFVPFTPWTTLEGYRELLAVLSENDLVEHVAPIQLGIRLLIPEGSRLLELADVRRDAGAFDAAALVYPWRHSDARLDALAARVQELAAEGDRLKQSRSDTFANIWRAAAEAAGAASTWQPPAGVPRAAIPHFSEPWYCCAEPTADQFVAIAATSPPRAQPDAFV